MIEPDGTVNIDWDAVEMRDPETGFFEDTQIVVDNQGGHVRNFIADHAYFFAITASADVGQITKLELLVSGFLNAQEVSAAGKGVLTTMIKKGNNSLAFKFERSLREAASARNWSFANVDRNLYVRLSYSDLLDREHVDYYRVQAVSGGQRIPDSDGREVFHKWQRMSRDDLPSLDANKVLDRISKKMESSSPAAR